MRGAAAGSKSLVGQNLEGRYRLEAEIGASGLENARLYRARHGELKHPVAVHHVIGASDAQRRQFAREAEQVAALEHPNIAAVVDFGAGKARGDACFLVTEWLEGESLIERLQRGPLVAAEVQSIARQLLAALSALHVAGVAHGRLKPSSVFLQRRKQGPERVKLLGAGLGAFAPRRAAAASKPSLKPPEPQQPDPRADVYAAGKVLAALLRDRRPRPRDPLAAPQPSAAVPSRRDQPLEDALRRVVRRALAHDPNERFADAAAMLQDLVDRLPPRLRAAGDRLPEQSANEASPVGLRALELEPALPRGILQPAAPSVAAKLPALARLAPVLGLESLMAAGMVAAGGALLMLVLWLRSPAGALPASLANRTYTARASQLSGASTETTRSAAQAAPANTPPAGAGATRPAVALTPGRPAPRDPWLEAVPPELQGLQPYAASGGLGDDGILRRLHSYNAEHRDDGRGCLLVARMYVNRLWRSDAVAQFAIALKRDPSLRGAPDVLPALLNITAVGRSNGAAEALIEEAYGLEALEQVDAALAKATIPVVRARLRALRERLVAPPAQ